MNRPTCRTLSPHPSIECVRTAGHNGQHRSYRGRTWTDEPADYADGGVTAAAIENEVVSPERARSLVQERDEWKARFLKGGDLFSRERTRAEKAEQELEQSRRGYGALMDKLATTARQRDEADRNDRPRPLTVDDITDEMRIRAWRAMREWENREWSLTHEQAGDMVLRAALTPPPSRPEGAEEIERLLTEDLGDFSPPATPEAIADLLAVRGVRVTGAES